MIPMKPGRTAISSLLVSLGLYLAGPAFSQSSTPSSSPPSISPDKQWQYVPGEKRKLVKTETNETVVEFDCNASEPSVLAWAPDSRRFAITCPGGKGSYTSVYQWRNGKWEAGDEELGNGDAIMDRAGDIIQAQAKKKGMPKKSFLHMNRWTVEPEKWIDSSTLVVYAEMWEVAHRNDGSYAGASYSTDLLLTLKFDDTGAWKIIKTHEMSEKEVKRRESSAR